MDPEHPSEPLLPSAASARLGEERAELQMLLESPTFTRAPILSRLLAHVCDRHFRGLGGELKESTIAVEVFRRTADFDSRQDPIVRVNANRLREALARFYRGEGKDHPLQIVVPPGQYVPVFRAKDAPIPEGRRTGPSEHAASPSTDASSLARERHPGRIAIPPLALAALLGVLAGLLWRGPVPGRAAPLSASPPAGTLVARSAGGAPFSDSALRLLAGATSGAIDTIGQQWSRDAYFEGGTAIALPPLPAAGGSPVYRAARRGRFAYDIPLPPGVYELRLHFVETDFGNVTQGGETSRLFDVELNGRRVLRDLDVIADAGGSRVPDVKVVTDVSPAADGRVHLRFSHARYDAILSGIELLPGVPGRMRPLRVAAHPLPYLAADGLLWSPDQMVRGGQTVPRTRPVAGTSDPGLFRAERFGNFRYTIPVAPGHYRLSLVFAETFFGPSNGVPAGRAARVFDVFCNGQALLRGFDIFAEAGGENRALVKVFPGLEPNAQGKLILDFVPVRNLATLTALEVVAE